jgi:cytochrome P450 / NADPH-cytochrome P450 reductase
MTTPIGIEDLPGPRALPVIGKLLDIDAASPFIGLMELAREYGPIFRLATPAGPR